jgi:hypothetical protein
LEQDNSKPNEGSESCNTGKEAVSRRTIFKETSFIGADRNHIAWKAN